jgi:C-terminal processing protease CtpA/Prc
MPDLSYQVAGIVKENGKPAVEGIEPEDMIISIDGFLVKGATMGSVVDKLRGKTGETRVILINRTGKELRIEGKVKHII